MKPIDPLRIQSLVDGELSASEASAVQRELDSDPSARAVYDSLVKLRTVVRQGDIQRNVPVAGDFYWQQIARRIEREAGSFVESAPVESPDLGLSSLVRRFFPAFGTLAALLLVTGVVWFQFGGAERYARLATNHDIERTSQEVATISFRSESEGITVVWVDTHPVD